MDNQATLIENNLNHLSTSSQFLLLSSISETELYRLDRPRVLIRLMGDKRTFKIDFSQIINERLEMQEFKGIDTSAAAVATAHHLLHDRVRSVAYYPGRAGHPRWVL